MRGFKHYKEQLKALGKYKTGKSCLNVKRLDDIDLDVLRALAQEAWDEMNRRYPPE